jgi:hypothetical protein
MDAVRIREAIDMLERGDVEGARRILGEVLVRIE